ncbi:MAG: SspB family protein [Rhodospirillales bacterium]|jgi:hypothetical protein
MTNDTTGDTPNDPIQYDLWIEDALRTVAHRALTYAEKHGLPGEHHFYITFLTTADGVEIPKFLLAQYPEEMTIVLQHQFEGLEVADDAFQVSLRFGGQPANLRVPFSTITAFTDPSVKFGLQYAKAANAEKKNADTEEAVTDEDAAPEINGDETAKTGEVIALDAFRKK